MIQKKQLEFSRKLRCAWVIPGDALYEEYHDNEWGVPLYDDKKLFELLVLEGAQSGLSWITVLRKREGYRRAFAGFDPSIVASYTEDQVKSLVDNPEIIRHKGKIVSAVNNAKAFIKIQNSFGSFSQYIWGFVEHKPIINHFKDLKELPTQTDLSLSISKDLKKRGFSYVGPTTIYSFLQAAGLVNDHLASCFCSSKETWYVYMIRTDDRRLYTGITKDMDKRLLEHKSGKKGAKFFRCCKALNIEYFETYPSRSDALKRECDIKKMGKEDKENLIRLKN